METLVTWIAASFLLAFAAVGACSMFMKFPDPQNKNAETNPDNAEDGGDGAGFGCLSNGELVKVNRVHGCGPVPLSPMEMDKLFLEQWYCEREAEVQSVKRCSDGGLEAKSVWAGTDKTLVFCHDLTGKEDDFYALTENETVLPPGQVMRAEKGPRVKIRRFVFWNELADACSSKR